MKIVVTGGAGRLGRRVVDHLRGAGHHVLSVDLVPVGGAEHGTHRILDLTDFGQTVEAIAGHDTVVHLGAVWAAGVLTDSATFHTNVSSTYNVFSAAAITGVSRVVWASTGAVTGAPFGWGDPATLPIDETIATRPQSAYALSKYVGEAIAPYFAENGGLSIVGMRLGWIIHPGGYEVVRGWNEKPMSRRFNAFVYVDARDVCDAVRQTLEAAIEGSHVVNICASDTCINRPSADLASEAFASAKVARPLEGFESLVSIEGARKLFGFNPQHTWRDEIGVADE